VGVNASSLVKCLDIIIDSQRLDITFMLENLLLIKVWNGDETKRVEDAKPSKHESS